MFSAHAADFCSRSGGTIALYTSRGIPVHVVDLTFGEQGESEDYWGQNGPRSLAEAKRTRAREAEEAAHLLGASIEFMDYDDYPLVIDRKRLQTLAHLLRRIRPDIILTHWKLDPFNVDHEVTTAAVIRAATMAAVPGFEPDAGVVHPLPHIFGFEPTIPRDDVTSFIPDSYMDISDVFETKVAALRALRSQTKLVSWYTQWAQYRGSQATQWSGHLVKYAEAFKRYTAFVGTQLP